MAADLQAHDVRVVGDELAQDVAAAVVPRERPGGAVRVDLARGVDLGEAVVRDQGEAEPVHVGPELAGLAHLGVGRAGEGQKSRALARAGSGTTAPSYGHLCGAGSPLALPWRA